MPNTLRFAFIVRSFQET